MALAPLAGAGQEWRSRGGPELRGVGSSGRVRLKPGLHALRVPPGVRRRAAAWRRPRSRARVRRVRAHGRVRAQPGVHALALQAELLRVGARERRQPRPARRVRRRGALGQVRRAAGADGRAVQRIVRDRGQVRRAERRQPRPVRQGAALRGRRPRPCADLRPARGARRVRDALRQNGSAVPAHVQPSRPRVGDAHARSGRPGPPQPADRLGARTGPRVRALRPLALRRAHQLVQAALPRPLLRAARAAPESSARAAGALAAPAGGRAERRAAGGLCARQRRARAVPVRVGAQHTARARRGRSARAGWLLAHGARGQARARAPQPARAAAARLSGGGRGGADHRARRAALLAVAHPLGGNGQAHVLLRHAAVRGGGRAARARARRALLGLPAQLARAHAGGPVRAGAALRAAPRPVRHLRLRAAPTAARDLPHLPLGEARPPAGPPAWSRTSRALPPPCPPPAR